MLTSSKAGLGPGSADDVPLTSDAAAVVLTACPSFMTIPSSCEEMAKDFFRQEIHQ